MNRPAMNHPGTGHHLPAMLSGAGFVLLSVVSVVLSLGAPGLGWGLATVTVIALSLCARLVGRRWLCVCLALALVHLLTLGPLGGRAGSSFGSHWLVGAVFAALPFVAGVGALMDSRSRPGK